MSVLEAMARGMQASEHWSSFFGDADAAAFVRAAREAAKDAGWQLVPVLP